MKRGWQWPVLVSLALAFTVGVNVVMLLAAGSDPNGTVVEPDYYRKAVEWDRTMARRAASAALGWSATASIGAATTSPVQRRIAVSLTDAGGAALSGAEVSATLIHNREASAPVTIDLQEGDAGQYVGAGALLHAGQWELRIAARRGRERFETSLRIEAP